MSIPPSATNRLLSLPILVAGAVAIMGAVPKGEPFLRSEAKVMAPVSVPHTEELARQLKRIAADDASSVLFELHDADEMQKLNAESCRPWLLER